LDSVGFCEVIFGFDGYILVTVNRLRQILLCFVPNLRNAQISLVDNCREESWRCSQIVLSLSPPRQTVRSVFPNTAFQSSSSRGFRFCLPFGIASTGVPGTFGVDSVTAISFPSFLEKHDEGIAPSFSQSYAAFEMQIVTLDDIPLSYVINCLRQDAGKA